MLLESDILAYLYGLEYIEEYLQCIDWTTVRSLGQFEPGGKWWRHCKPCSPVETEVKVLCCNKFHQFLVCLFFCEESADGKGNGKACTLEGRLVSHIL